MDQRDDVALPQAQQQPAPAAAPQPAVAVAPPPMPNRRILWRVLLAAIALLGALLILYAWELPPFTRTIQRTENAYVRGQVTIISPQVSGYVTSVHVQDYQTVEKGELLATIDDRIYRQKVDQAKASLHAARVALANSTQAQNSARGSVSQQNANILGAQAALAKARADETRMEELYRRGWATRAQIDASRAALQSAQAQLAQSRASESIAETSVTSAVVNKGSLQASVENAEAALRLAQIDLDNTRIIAPMAGKLGEVAVRLGAQVATGTQLMTLVPRNLWVVANLKETQMKRVRVGQPATLAIDALGGQKLRGHVERISPATGSEFAVIRTDNASGNFTKVAQRIPVRIAIDPGQPLAERLAPGMSVVARVDTRDTP